MGAVATMAAYTPRATPSASTAGRVPRPVGRLNGERHLSALVEADARVNRGTEPGFPPPYCTTDCFAGVFIARGNK